jgi:hypothetical protein
MSQNEVEIASQTQHTLNLTLSHHYKNRQGEELVLSNFSFEVNEKNVVRLAG